MITPENDLDKNLLYTVKKWYTNTYPTDDLGKELCDVSFATAYNYVHLGEKYYQAIGVGDSLVRERIFEKLSEISGLDYDDIYDAWLHKEELPQLYSASGLGKASRNFLPFNVVDPIYGIDKGKNKVYVEYAIECFDNDLFYSRLGFDEACGYKTFSDLLADYPDAYCNLYVRVYNTSSVPVELSMSIVEGPKDSRGKEPFLVAADISPFESQKLCYVISSDLESNGENMGNQIKAAEALYKSGVSSKRRNHEIR